MCARKIIESSFFEELKLTLETALRYDDDSVSSESGTSRKKRRVREMKMKRSRDEGDETLPTTMRCLYFV